MITSILDSYFTGETMSVHFQQGQCLLSKVGKPGGWQLIHGESPRSKKDITGLMTEIYAEIEGRDDAFIEIERSASKVLQLGPYRIVIVEAPVANSLEITVVKPIAKLHIDAYMLEEDILHRLIHTAQGILIAGAPGEGKTTFAQALIEEIAKKDVIIKTIESPRDLVVPASVTQYSSTHAPHDELRDILLLSRPDYSIYDEIRNTADFHLYTDLRLTGIGLIGVMHATKAVDSIQRFIGAVNMGTVSQVIDTIVFIKAGKVDDVLSLEQVVGTPSGMQSDDLARPLILVSSLLQQKPLYEIYSYADNVVVMPLDKIAQSGKDKKENSAIETYAKKAIETHLKELIDYRCHIEITGANTITLYAPDSIKGRIIGKQGKRIEEIQKITGLHISVRSPDEMSPGANILDIPYEINEIHRGKKTRIDIQFDPSFAHQDVKIMLGGQLMTFTANHEGVVAIRRKVLIDHIHEGNMHVVG